MFRTKLTVRYSETDSMGVVHHSRYFPWFEVGRTEFFKTTGMSYREVEEKGVLLPLLDCYSKFIKGARYQDDIWIEVSLKQLGVAKCRFEYNVVRCEDNVLLAVGYTTHGFTDKDFKPINLKKRHPEIYSVLEGLLED
ncbi:MAG: acyl-CoA thioesterase [Clostridiales bacterium]|nr:acyl-CoA thioesterase [Clostridiales bacterium]